jgi:hypothetical protein
MPAELFQRVPLLNGFGVDFLGQLLLSFLSLGGDLLDFFLDLERLERSFLIECLERPLSFLVDLLEDGLFEGPHLVDEVVDLPILGRDFVDIFVIAFQDFALELSDKRELERNDVVGRLSLGLEQPVELERLMLIAQFRPGVLELLHALGHLRVDVGKLVVELSAAVGAPGDPFLFDGEMMLRHPCELVAGILHRALHEVAAGLGLSNRSSLVLFFRQNRLRSGHLSE